MHISLGFSPCPNDTFMFAALVNHWIDTQGFTFTVHLEDVEQLNKWAGSGFLDFTKLSFHRALTLAGDYHLLDAGSALGRGCGPLLIGREKISDTDVIRGPVALPGNWTTAHLLFKIFYPQAENKLFAVFSKIEELVLSGSVAAGVIIHENRFTYEEKGLVKLADLGALWENKTGLPIPLGGIFAKSSIEKPVQKAVSDLIRKSILYAYDHPQQVMDYVRPFAQEMDATVMKSHIDLYVNEFSLNLGPEGHSAVDHLAKSLL